MMNVLEARSVAVVPREASSPQLPLLEAIARDRRSVWTHDDLAELVENGCVLLGVRGTAVVAVLGLVSDDERDDAARVALLWETRPYDDALMGAVMDEAARQCRQQGFSAIAVEVPEGQPEDISLFTQLGFAIIEAVPTRVVSAEEREHWGFAQGTTIAGHTLLEYSV